MMKIICYELILQENLLIRVRKYILPNLPNSLDV